MKTKRCFGLHFDFHASPESCPEPIGKGLKEEEIREICRTLKPDFIQIDGKGHPGWSSYPTRAGNSMPEIVGDPMALWRRVTKEEGVALFVHYSGVWDARYCSEHPEEAVLGADGVRDTWATRTNGKYADEVLIPQLCEIAGKYGADGIWVDGECWGTRSDFDPRTVKLYEERTGNRVGDDIPSEPSHPLYQSYRDFCRDLFREYLTHYVAAVHEKHPDFMIASNWAFTDHMPEEPFGGVDFISGDMPPDNAVNFAAYSSRAAAGQGLPWDMMSWNFRNVNSVQTPKHPNQLLQEAAEVISVGGGYQDYITMDRDGSPRTRQILDLKPLADFVRDRQEFCFEAETLPEVLLLLSARDRYLEAKKLFYRTGMHRSLGLTSLLCDAGVDNGIIMEHQLNRRLADCRVLIVPELYERIDGKALETVREYVKNGGALVTVGPKACRYFAAEGFIPEPGETRDAPADFFDLSGRTGTLSGYAPLSPEGEVIASAHPCFRAPDENGVTPKWSTAIPKGVNEPMAAVYRYGKGSVAAIAADLGTEYHKNAQYLYKELMKDILDRLYEPRLRLEGSVGVTELALTRKNGRLFVQMTDRNGTHRDPTVLTDPVIPPCLDVTVSLRAAKAPKAVILRPQNREIPFVFRDGRIFFTVDRLDIHAAAEIVE